MARLCSAQRTMPRLSRYSPLRAWLATTQCVAPRARGALAIRAALVLAPSPLARAQIGRIVEDVVHSRRVPHLVPCRCGNAVGCQLRRDALARHLLGAALKHANDGLGLPIMLDHG